MIRREISTYDWTRPTITLDSYGQSVSTEIPLGTIDAAVYFDAQVSLNNPLFVEATHVGLTKNKTVLRKDKIGTFEILAINPIGRYNQLILKQV